MLATSSFNEDSLFSGNHIIPKHRGDEALTARPSYKVFHKVTLHTHPCVPWDLLSSEPDNLLVFFPKTDGNQREARLHTSDVLWALSFCLDRTQTFRVLPRLFTTFADRVNCQAILFQGLSKWVSNCNKLYYLTSLDLHIKVRSELIQLECRQHL